MKHWNINMPPQSEKIQKSRKYWTYTYFMVAENWRKAATEIPVHILLFLPLKTITQFKMYIFFDLGY